MKAASAGQLAILTAPFAAFGTHALNSDAWLVARFDRSQKGRDSALFTTALSLRSTIAAPRGRHWCARRALQSSTLAKRACTVRCRHLRVSPLCLRGSRYRSPRVSPMGHDRRRLYFRERARSRHPTTGHSSSPNSSIDGVSTNLQVGCSAADWQNTSHSAHLRYSGGE